MKAVIWTAYGPPEVLQLQDVEKPKAKANEVLIRVHATTVETGDCELRRYEMHNAPYYLFRPMFGLFRPRLVKILGQQLSGEVVEVGGDVTRFKPGDKVLAAPERMGAMAEYVVLPEQNAMTHKPDTLSYAEAAALPVGGCNALHFLRLADIQPGQQVLVYGSTGAIGTFAVQLAKQMGAEVTAVCSAGRVEFVKGLGADHILDYHHQSLRDAGQSFDVVFDTIGKSPFSESLAVLKPKGIYLLANPTFSQQLRAYWTNLTSSKRVTRKLAKHNSDDLHYLTQLFERGDLKVIVDRIYPMSQVVEAHHYVEQGHKCGNVVVSVSGEDLREKSDE